jgi:hypothetical protein
MENKSSERGTFSKVRKLGFGSRRLGRGVARLLETDGEMVDPLQVLGGLNKNEQLRLANIFAGR